MPTLSETDDYRRSLKWYAKKKPRELEAVLTNLKRLLDSMTPGKPILASAPGFARPEPNGVVRVGEGGNAGMAATRLYLYHEVATDTVYLLTIGDKRSQQDDIELCKNYVELIRERHDHGSDQDDGIAEDEAGQGGDEAGEESQPGGG